MIRWWELSSQDIRLEDYLRIELNKLKEKEK